MLYVNKSFFLIFVGLNLVALCLVCGFHYYSKDLAAETRYPKVYINYGKEDSVVPPAPNDDPIPTVPTSKELPTSNNIEHHSVAPPKEEPEKKDPPKVTSTKNDPPKATSTKNEPAVENKLPENSVCSEIDVVYLWVNGSDPLVTEQYKSVFGENLTVTNRLRDIPTLKYSIRATLKFAPFIRNIIVVTNGQKPDWLNVSHPRVRLVSHAEIYERPDFLPVFCSNAIETQLHRIPGLAPCWWWFNDDFSFGRPIKIDDWIDLKTGQQKLAFLIGTAPTSRPSNMFDYSVSYTNWLLNKYLYPRDFTNKTTIQSVRHRHRYEGHGARFIVQKNFESMYEKFYDEMLNTSSHRLRQKDDVSVAFLYNHYVRIALGGVESNTLSRGMSFGYFRGDPKKDRESIKQLVSRKPICWCMNDDAPVPKNDEELKKLNDAIDAVVEVLEKEFPEPSEVENKW